MISENEVTKGQVIPEEFKANLKDLLKKINIIRTAYAHPMTITSGYRSMAHHISIYEKKALDRGLPFYEGQVPKKSKHLFCQAIDVYDPDGKVHDWCKRNDKLLRETGLFLEARQGSWQHFQSVPFGSFKEGGTIWFNP